LETAVGSYNVILNNRTNDRTPLAKMDANQERIIAQMDVNVEKIEARFDACLEKMEAWTEKMMTRREATEAYPEKLEPNPEEMKSIAEHQEDTKEEAEVETIGALEDRYGDRRLIVRRHGRPKKRTQGHGGSRQKLAAACRRLTRHAVPASRKLGRCCKQNP
jgi:hypothetical protein